MQVLIKTIENLRKKGAGDQEVLNVAREYLQVLILKAIYTSKYGKNLSFMGGTCLRICYDLKRYSEDLDFALKERSNTYSFKKLNEVIVTFLKNTNFEVDAQISEDKVVQKSYIKIHKILHFFQLSPLKEQKIHVKIEIDTNPIKTLESEIETFFVSKFNELFPILKHNNPTLFSGKILAILNRKYTKGRDFYDLIWYLKNHTGINLRYLNQGLKIFKLGEKVSDQQKVFAKLDKVIQKTDFKDVLKDLGLFLEDKSERDWIVEYGKVYEQMKTQYLRSGEY